MPGESWCDACPFKGRACKGSILPEHCPAIVGGEPGGRTPPAETRPREILLAGDLVAAVTARLGADRLAKWLAKVATGVPDCGCLERQRKLNEIDARLRKWLGIGAR
jgi:hypothetical protein